MDDPIDIWFESQSLHQEGDMDCGVCVFGKLANLTREEILRGLQGAERGKEVHEWMSYLKEKLAPNGLKPKIYKRGESYPLPCAHLVIAWRPHWVYEAENGGIHDPSDSANDCPPRLLKLEQCGTPSLAIGLESA
jgi:hypothetical protein